MQNFGNRDPGNKNFLNQIKNTQESHSSSTGTNIRQNLRV
jgi:hypothetical protein